MYRFALFIASFLILLTACQPSSTPSKPITHASEFTSCYLENYAQAYDSLPLHVYALDLYSDGLSLNEQGKIEGTGTNLYISDMFIVPNHTPWTIQNGHISLQTASDTILLQSDSIPSACTFLPGMDFEGNPTGIYLLSIVDNAIAGIQVLDSGMFILSSTADDGIEFRATFYYSTRSSANAKPTLHTFSAHSIAPWQPK